MVLVHTLHLSLVRLARWRACAMQSVKQAQPWLSTLVCACFALVVVFWDQISSLYLHETLLLNDMAQLIKRFLAHP